MVSPGIVKHRVRKVTAHSTSKLPNNFDIKYGLATGEHTITIKRHNLSRILIGRESYVAYYPDSDGLVIRWGPNYDQPDRFYYLLSFDIEYDADKTNPRNYVFVGLAKYYYNKTVSSIREKADDLELRRLLVSKGLSLNALLLSYIQSQSNSSLTGNGEELRG